MFKQLAVAACLIVPLAGFAADEKKAPTAQQQKMATCNQEAGAKNLAGDARKAFMKECLSGGNAASSAKTKQQEKMTACNKQAGEKALKGDERKKFMSACLSG